MPAVNFTIRWPDGHETTGYSPSTIIFDHLQAGSAYTLNDFNQRLELALNEASERVRQLRGFYCSSAMDTLGRFRYQASRYAEDDKVQVLDMQKAHTGQVLAPP